MLSDFGEREAQIRADAAENLFTWTELIDRLLPDNGDPVRQHLMWAIGSVIAVFAGKGYTNRQIMAACALHFAVAYEAEGWGECDQYTIYRALGLEGDISGPINTRPAAEADPRMAAIAHGQSDEYRERFLREKQPPSPFTPPAAEVCERTHELKTWPQYFEALIDGRKTFEYRRDDRGYAIGDVLLLREYDPESRKYTGRECFRRVDYIARGGVIPDGYVVMSISPTKPLAGENESK